MNNLEYNKKQVKRLLDEVFCGHDFSRLDEIMREDYIQHNADVPGGRAGFRQFFEATFKGVPDFKYTMKKIIAEGDIVMLFSTTSGTHSGDWIEYPATGNRLNFDVVDIFRIQDGKIAEHWDVADTLKLFSTLGAVQPAPGKHQPRG